MGVIAFECVTGKRPFDGTTLGQLFMAICTTPLPVPSATALPGGAAIPPVLAAFDAWFARAASRDPLLRFGSAGEMAEALCAIFAPGGIGESAIPTVASSSRAAPSAPLATGRNDAWSTGRVDPRPQGTPVAFLAGLVLAPVLVLTAGGLWWWRAHRSAAAEVVSLSSATAAATAPPAPPTVSAPAAASAEVPAPSAIPAVTATASAAASSKPAGRRPPARGRTVTKADTDRIGL
ncbi:MAG: hypothetical protein QM820_26665 [Minicystis sp.]